MATVPVRASEKAYRQLEELANSTGESKASLLEKAVELLHRDWYWDKVNQAYAAAGDSAVEEAEAWAHTLNDGMEGV